MFDPTAGYIHAQCERCGDGHDIEALFDGLCMACEAEEAAEGEDQ